MSERPVRVALVAGEASGDLLAAGLMQSLRHHYPDIEFMGVGGTQMERCGLQSLFPMDRLSVMGITEVLGRLPELLRLRRRLVRYLVAQAPDVYIGIDSPDFNLPIAARLHRRGIRTVHYVSPSVWAWRQGRIEGIRESIDLMLTLLPFEARFYQDHKVPVAFVGHPMADRIPLEEDKAAARSELVLPDRKPVVAVLPGSRGGEVGKLMPVFLRTIALLQQRYPEIQCLVPAAGPERHRQIRMMINARGIKGVTLVLGQSRTVMAAADVVLLASGTASLEAMLLKKPMVVGYRMGRVTAWILSRMVKTPWVALPNLLAREMLVPEFLQQAMTPEALADAVGDWIDHPDKAEELKARFTELHRELQRGANDRAAEAVRCLLEESRG
jgi:lipid-A-disaccharide synthase